MDPLATATLTAFLVVVASMLSVELAISSVYGLNAGIIDRGQFSILIATVILSAVLTTLAAQRFSSPPRQLLTVVEELHVEDEEFAPRHLR
jgi:uncharacterized membrane protein YozB (DUF420 family)